MTPWAQGARERERDRVLREIDWSRDEIVLWLPGTSEQHVPGPLRQSVGAQFGGLEPVGVFYGGTWKLEGSVENGRLLLADVLRAIEERPGEHRVYLAGQSQGAWIISEVLEDGEVAGQVERAALFGHPSFAPTHDHSFQPGDRVLEINHRGDSVPAPLDDAKTAVSAIDGITRGDVVGNVFPLAKVVAQNPSYAWTWLMSQRHMLPFVGDRFPNPHDYRGDMAAGVTFLRTGEPAAGAATT